MPDGWLVAAPDFVGIGVPGTASAWWLSELERHPNVARAADAATAVHWFDRFWAEDEPDDLTADYARWFPRPAGHRSGEWTPSYLGDFWIPPILARAAPGARILVLLADPLARFLASFARATQASPRRWDERDAIGAFARGLHAEQLRALFHVYPRDQVLVLVEETCRIDPQAELRRTFAHLGLDAAVTLAPSTLAPPALPRDPGSYVPESILRAIGSAYAAEVAQLAELVPQLDLGRWTVPQRLTGA